MESHTKQQSSEMVSKTELQAKRLKSAGRAQEHGKESSGDFFLEVSDDVV